MGASYSNSYIYAGHGAYIYSAELEQQGLEPRSQVNPGS